MVILIGYQKMTVFDILVQYREGFAAGLFVTFKLVLIIWVLGIFFGSLLGSMASKWKKVVGIPSQLIAFGLSGVPVLVFLFWLHYPMQAILNVVIDPFITAVATLTILNTFAVSELLRQVLVDFPQQYLTAAKVCGLSPLETLLHVQLPIVFRQTLPGLLMIQVNMLQCTLFASLISVDEIFRVAQRINSIIYKPVEIYSALGLLFLFICLPMNGVAILLRRTFTRDFSET